MLTNTREFQRLAQYHTKHGKYTDIPRGTVEYKSFWDMEIEKCLKGVKIGDTYISGYHYFYLNFCKIMRTEETFGTVHDSKPTNIITEKDDFFPAFWDGDHQYFNVVERCENPGNPLIDIRGLNVINNGKRKHLIVLKARGKGYSFKGGAMMARNYFLIKKSKSYGIASEREFLTSDGLLNKAWSYLDFIDQNTEWRKRRLKNGPMLKQAGYKSTDEFNVETSRGYMSQIIGVTLKNDIQKARGKRGKLIVWEEVGKFPGFKRAWQIARPSVEDRDIVTGLMVAQGTGGTEGANFEDVEDMFYHPDAYNAVAVENFWDEGGAGSYCGFFHPSYMNAGSFMDEAGNSHHDEAKEFDLNQREIIAKNASSPNEVDQEAAENPHTPREACLQISGNIFPKLIAEQCLNRLRVDSTLNIGVPIELEEYTNEYGRKAIRISTNPKIIEKLKPIIKFPTPKDAGEGCIVMYELPYKRNGIIPDDLYYCEYDPFAQDGGKSLGSFAIKKRINRWSTPDDIVVAEYNGRPPSTLDFDRRGFMLAEFYNAMIGFENNTGDVLPNARLLKKVHLLEPQFTLEYNNDLKNSPVSRPYGMHISEPRKIAGEGYYNDWLRRVRGIDPTTGEQILNIHTIKDPAHLEEIIAYNRKGNFDRISRSIIGTFYEKELDYLERKVEVTHKTESFMNREGIWTDDDADNWAANDVINIDNYNSGGQIIKYL